MNSILPVGPKPSASRTMAYRAQAHNISVEEAIRRRLGSPLGRMGDPAEFVTWRCSVLARGGYVHGAMIPVDGRSIKRRSERDHTPSSVV